jgi:hypothetical protein
MSESGPFAPYLNAYCRVTIVSIQTINSLISHQALISGHELIGTSLLIEVTMATDYGQDDQEVGVGVPVESRMFTSPRLPDWLLGPPGLQSNGYWRLFPRGWGG